MEHEVKRRTRFSITPHALAQDKRISLQARGLYQLYDSFAWNNEKKTFLTEDHLCDLACITPKKLRALRSELVDSGWIEVERYRDPESGRFGRVIVWVNEEPKNPVITTTGNYTTYGENESTTGLKSTGGKRTGPKEDEALKKRNTNTDPVCAPSEVGKTIPLEVMIYIDKKCAEPGVKNPGGMRTVLVKKWVSGELILPPVAQSNNEPRCEALRRIDQWEQEKRV